MKKQQSGDGLAVVPKGQTQKGPPKVYRTKSDYLADALVILEVTREQIDPLPKIEHLFKDIGGKTKVLEYLGGSEEKEARMVVDLRGRLTKKQSEAVPFEAYCVAAGVSPKKMFGIISQEVMEQSTAVAKLLSKAAHPSIVKATIDAAKRPLGVHDRRMLHQAEGFVPVPKNSITHIHGNVDQRTQVANVAVLPPVEDSVRRLSDRFNTSMEMPLLAAPSIEEDDEGDDAEEE